MAIEPGQGFGVHVTWPAFVQQIQSVEPIGLQYEVTACDSFTLEARLDGGEYSQGTWEQLPVEKAGGGRSYRASVDAAQLLPRSGAACYAAADSPMDFALELQVTCSDGRVAKSNRVPMQFATGEHVAFVAFQRSFLHGLDANRTLVVNRREVAIAHLDETLGDKSHIRAVRRQSVAVGEPATGMAHNATETYVAGVCSFPHCVVRDVEDAVTHQQLSVPDSEVFVVDWQRRATDANDRKLVKSVLQVPGSYLELFAQPDGSILALGGTEVDLDHVDSRAPGLVVSRITGSEVRVEAVIPDELRHETSSTGVVITQRGDRFALRTVQALREVQPMRIDVPKGARLFMAPDGFHWLAMVYGPGQQSQSSATSRAAATRWRSMGWQRTIG